MPDTASLMLFMGATLALNITPGPDMLYVIARSSCEGTRSGVVSSLGIAVGALVHLAAVTLGLSSLLQAVPLAYAIVRYAGAAFLLYLGLRALLARPRASAEAVLERASPGRVFRQGVITNVLNPKVALFFAAFLPQFADPARGSVWSQLVFLGLLFNLSGTTVNLLVAYVAGSAGDRVRSRLGSPGVWQRLTEPPSSGWDCGWPSSGAEHGTFSDRAITEGTGLLFIGRRAWAFARSRCRRRQGAHPGRKVRYFGP